MRPNRAFIFLVIQEVDVKTEVCQILNIMTEAQSDKYLGLPALVGTDRSDCFRHLIDRVVSRIDGWKEKILSMGGKEILIKSIAQAVPVYAMMVFKIPNKICKGITDAISQYWWGDDADHRRIHWQEWWKMCMPKGKGGMGFRDLQSFNLALLAKQVWRLQSDPDSLCARVLRARYYLDGKLLNARMKSGSSYTWQSILAGLQCFKQGYIWRVGDGTQIKIWEDNWIPGSHNMKIQTNRGNNLVATVDELIDPINFTWGGDLLKTIFWPIDVCRIMQIPIRAGRDDLVAWQYNRSGTFSVKSAYHCQWDYKFGERSAQMQASTASRSRLWKRLWNLKVPAKIKIFGWRALKGLVPCRAILANRHVGDSGGCPVCQNGPEDIKHMIFTCARAKQVWNSLGVEDRIQRLCMTERSGSVILEEILIREDQVQDLQVGFAELVITAAWYIWWERRQLVHGEAVQRPARSGMAIAALTKNYKLATKKDSVLRQGWKKPPEGKVMVNVDAGFDEMGGCGTVGSVIRDCSGGVLAAAHSFVPHLVDAPMAEAFALKEGLMLAQQIGCNRLIIQSDCMEVVQIMTDGGFTANSAAAIYEDCNILWSGFADITIEHCSREANQVAHNLARRAREYETNCTWVDEPPRFILDSLMNDVTILNE